MERCYVCNHCGKCDDDALAIAPPVLACLDCGHEVQPGGKSQRLRRMWRQGASN